MRWRSGLVLFLLGVAVGVPTGARWFAPVDRAPSTTPGAEEERARVDAAHEVAAAAPARPPKAGVSDPGSAFEAWLRDEPVHLKLVATGWPHAVTMSVLHDGPTTIALSEDGKQEFAIGEHFPRAAPHGGAFQADLEQVLDLRAIARWLARAKSWDTWYAGQRRAHARYRKLEGLTRGEITEIDVQARFDLGWNLEQLRITVSRVDLLQGPWRVQPQVEMRPQLLSLDTVLQHPRDAGRLIALEGAPAPRGPVTTSTTFEFTRSDLPPSETLQALLAKYASR
jgi:hypothetical protein